MKKIFLAISLLFLGLLFLFGRTPANIVNADTGFPSGSITASWDAGTHLLTTSGSYSWGGCTAGNTDKLVGFALFINGGNPTSNDSNALDGSGMHLANGGAPCTTSPGSWSDNSHTVDTAPTSVCVVIYDVRSNASSGNHSQIGAGSNHNTDNSYEENGNSYGIQVKDGKIDLNQDGKFDGDDDGSLNGKTIKDAKVDWNNDGSVNTNDDSPGADYYGHKVIDGLVDMNDNGIVTGGGEHDNGSLSGSTSATCVAPTIITEQTPTPTPTPEPECENDCEETPTPTLTPTPTNTPNNPGGPGDGLGCSTHDCSNQSHPTQAVLGLSNTGSENNIYLNMLQLLSAAALAGAGFKLFRKHA